ncbi:MAG: hypothetical protein HC880_15400 [Bacteroidia bacterium]|nr:hypothetical protein [Bacteroidia bacterium]
MEKIVTLSVIDQEWKEHLRDMDDLKQSVQNAVYEQKDPLIVYKFEGYELFAQFIAKVNNISVSFLSKGNLPAQESAPVREAQRQRPIPKQKLNEKKAEVGSLLGLLGSKNGGGTAQIPAPELEPEKVMPIKSQNFIAATPG